MLIGYILEFIIYLYLHFILKEYLIVYTEIIYNLGGITV